jgi:hypothetical protein
MSEEWVIQGLSEGVISIVAHLVPLAVSGLAPCAGTGRRGEKFKSYITKEEV